MTPWASGNGVLDEAGRNKGAQVFTAVVRPKPTGVTFREQSEAWLLRAVSRFNSTVCGCRSYSGLRDTG